MTKRKNPQFISTPLPRGYLKVLQVRGREHLVPGGLVYVVSLLDPVDGLLAAGAVHSDVPLAVTLVAGLLVAVRAVLGQVALLGGQTGVLASGYWL